VAIPAHARGTFFAATGAAAAAFAVYGVCNSLMPGFLAGTMHETSYAVAGAVAFSAFAAGAIAQIALGTASTATTLKVSVPVLFAGLTLFTLGMWLPSLLVFVIGGIVTGAGGGLVFRGSLVAAASTAPPESRAEVLGGLLPRRVRRALRSGDRTRRRHRVRGGPRRHADIRGARRYRHRRQRAGRRAPPQRSGLIPGLHSRPAQALPGDVPGFSVVIRNAHTFPVDPARPARRPRITLPSTQPKLRVSRKVAAGGPIFTGLSRTGRTLHLLT
jgi:hypothetical protein